MNLTQTTGTDVPAKLIHQGGVYVLATHPDDRVELNVVTTCATREAVRTHAAALGTTMQDVVNCAVRLYLADRMVAA